MTKRVRFPRGVAIDYTYRLRQAHRSGQIARIAGAIADAEGLIGDIETINLTRAAVDPRDHGRVPGPGPRRARSPRSSSETDGVTVLWCRNRALMKHEGGKLTIEPVRPVETIQQMRDVYTPGVAQACPAIEDDPAKRHRLHDDRPHGRDLHERDARARPGQHRPASPSMPVMEGKAVFYRQFAGISAMPILIDTERRRRVRRDRRAGSRRPSAASTWRTSASPDCFEIEERLIEALEKPVMHDDVHGTAVVTLAAALVGCRRADKRARRRRPSARSASARPASGSRR